MNWIFGLIAFFSFISITIAQEDASCGTNEVFSCVRYCKRTCIDVGKKQCAEVPGCPRKTCHCKDNFYLNDEKQCVRKEECPSINTNGVLPSADSAAARVANAVQSVICLFERCETTTVAPTTVVAATPSPRYVYAGCGANQDRVACGTPCERTCVNPNPVCSQSPCLVNVCQCRPGFYRDGNRCIKPSECPQAVYSTTAAPAASPYSPIPRLRPYVGDYRPYYGMVTNYKTCPATEIYAVCIPCERACDSTNWLCHDYCVDGCTCDQVRGYYYRDRSTGKCVNRCPAYNTYSYNFWAYQPAAYYANYYPVVRRTGDLVEIIVNPSDFEDDNEFKRKAKRK